MNHLFDKYLSASYLYHGSRTAGLKELKPNQGYMTHPTTRQKTADGPASVSATPYLDIAIFIALHNKEVLVQAGVDPLAQCGLNNDTVHLAAHKDALPILRSSENIGYVYIIRRKDFNRFEERDYELRSSEAVKVVDCIAVDGTYLPDNISTNFLT